MTFIVLMADSHTYPSTGSTETPLYIDETIGIYQAPLDINSVIFDLTVSGGLQVHYKCLGIVSLFGTHLYKIIAACFISNKLILLIRSSIIF